jgi:hypothetical protein
MSVCHAAVVTDTLVPAASCLAGIPGCDVPRLVAEPGEQLTQFWASRLQAGSRVLPSLCRGAGGPSIPLDPTAGAEN